MITRTFDPAFLNSVCNHPEVRPWLYGQGEIDVTPFVTNADNFALVTDGGGFILVRHEPGIYEAHSQFLPDGRTGTRQAMREVFDYMFTRTDCERIITQIPDNNRAAAALGMAGKFRTLFRLEHTPRGPTAFVCLTIEEWAQNTLALETDSKWFHDPMAAAVKAACPDMPEHHDDRAHERAVGATVRMVRAGNAEKGVNFYNRWARFSGFTPIRPVSFAPLVLDVSEPGLSCIVGIKNDELEVLLCRSV
jgi:hypothetical protein